MISDKQDQQIQMQEIVNGNRTMYIKFPTVTKLQYPSDHHAEHQSLRTTTYRQTLLRQTHIKIDIINRAQSFKIIHLPQKNEIMNICRMTVREKQKDEDNRESSGEKLPRKKIFSVTKFNSLKQQAAQLESETFIRPLNIKKAFSTNKIKMSLPPPIQIDYLQTYSFVSKLIALSFGAHVHNEGPSRIRRAKLDLGNNGLLIKQTLKKRVWWTVAANEQSKQNQNESSISLLWTQYLVNRKNVQKIEVNNSPYFKVMQEKNLSFPRNFDKILNQLPKIRQLLFTEWEEQKRWKDLLAQLQKQQIIKLQVDNLILTNHLDNNWQITNKKLLYKNMVEYYNKTGINPHDKMPKTFHLTCFNWQDVIKNLRGDTCKWIIKPGQFTNRGHGINVFRNTKEAIDHILNHPPKNEQRSFLLQQYITPMLYQERKFDIRCYMLGVQIGKSMKFYWYEEGYIRTASQKFSLKKMGKGIHLTNDAVQKNMKHYGQHQSANKLSFNEIDKYCLNNTTFNFYNEILPEIKRMTRDICHAVGDSRLIGSGKGFNFEIFGLDYLIDEHGKPWLIQVNTNPSLQICCSLLSRIIPEMVQNAVRLVCDVFLPPKKAPQYSSNFLMNNRFSLIYSNTLGSK